MLSFNFNWDFLMLLKNLLKLDSDKLMLSYRHEAIVLGVEFNRKKLKVLDNQIKGKDMGDYIINYKPDFWNNLNLPPDSKFYTNSANQLENLYGIPLETQFIRAK